MRKKQKKRNEALYQAMIQAFLTAKFYGGWDAIDFADQGGETGEYGVAIKSHLPSHTFACMNFITFASYMGELVMTKCLTGCSLADLKKKHPKHDSTSYDIVENALLPYLPFIKICAEKLEADKILSGSDMKSIFDNLGLKF